MTDEELKALVFKWAIRRTEFEAYVYRPEVEELVLDFMKVAKVLTECLMPRKAPNPSPDVFRDLTNEQRKAIEGAVVLAIPGVPEILRGTRYSTQDETGQWLFTPVVFEEWHILRDAGYRFNRNGEIKSDEAVSCEMIGRAS